MSAGSNFCDRHAQMVKRQAVFVRKANRRHHRTSGYCAAKWELRHVPPGSLAARLHQSSRLGKGTGRPVTTAPTLSEADRNQGVDGDRGKRSGAAVTEPREHRFRTGVHVAQGPINALGPFEARPTRKMPSLPLHICAATQGLAGTRDNGVALSREDDRDNHQALDCSGGTQDQR